MSIVMIHDTENCKMCFVYSEKNIYTVNVIKSQYNVFLFRTSPITEHAYMYLIVTERSQCTK
jgi:hypothetical protein